MFGYHFLNLFFVLKNEENKERIILNSDNKNNFQRTSFKWLCFLCFQKLLCETTFENRNQACHNFLMFGCLKINFKENQITYKLKTSYII